MDGVIASLFSGAWMPADIANSAADGAGKWRVAQMPTADGSSTNVENGGSSLAVLSSSKKAQAAYDFIEYANHGDGVAARVAGGAFPLIRSLRGIPSKMPTLSRIPMVRKGATSVGRNITKFWLMLLRMCLPIIVSAIRSEVKASNVLGDYFGTPVIRSSLMALRLGRKPLQGYSREQGFTLSNHRCFHNEKVAVAPFSIRYVQSRVRKRERE